MENSSATLTSRFHGQPRVSHLEAMRREHWFIQAKQDKRRKDQAADDAENDLVDLGATVVMASATDIETFTAKLDRLDAATIEALDQNRIRLDDVRVLLEQADRRILHMLDQAHVMEDGRRVFLTRDRSQAFDEHGQEVSRDDLDYDLVGPDVPAYEDFVGELELRQELQEQADLLEAERETLLDFQERLDDMREETADGELSVHDLEALDAELDELMPDAVRRNLPEFQAQDAVIDAPSTQAERAPDRPAIPSPDAAATLQL